MIELIVKMTSWLVAAMVLGFLVAWLLSKIFYQRKYKNEEDTLSAIIVERNNMVDKLEKKFRNEKIMSEKTSDDLRDMEKAYAQKTSELTSMKSQLMSANNNEHESLKYQEKCQVLLSELQRLREIDRNRLKELEGFEEVLVKSEEELEVNEKHYKGLLKSLDNKIERLVEENEAYLKAEANNQKKITALEESLKLYKADSTEAEFIISKDQFVKIEEQLEAYQKEIVQLKKEKDDLSSKFKKTSLEKSNLEKSNLQKSNEQESVAEKVIDTLKEERDDSSVVKVFKETYKKITKS